MITAANAQSRQKYIDSLENEVVIHLTEDTNRAINLYKLCWELRIIDTAKSEAYGNEALRISLKLDFKRGIGAAYNNLGGLYEIKGDDVKALQYYNLALVAKRANKDRKGTASTLNNIGIIYKKQEYFERSLTYYWEAMALNRESGNKSFLLQNYYNIANSYKGLKRYDSTLYYYKLSLDLAQESENKGFCVDIYNSIGNYYVDQKDFQTGINYFDSSYAYIQLYGFYVKEYYYYHSKGRALYFTNQLDSAERYLMRAWELVKGTHDWVAVNNVSSTLSGYYHKRYLETRDTAFLGKAYEFVIRAYAARDSMLNDKKLHTIFDLVMDDVVNQKNAEIKAVEQERELIGLKADNERLFRNFLAAIVLAVVGVLFVLWLRFRKNKILTRKLEDQNTQIESKNKEIIDSITYAKRLQEAILPPVSMLRQFFPETFVLYLPKDIIAGDFYWSESSGDKFFIAAADCTGHGVPGAMVSVVCANALERTVNEFGIRETGKILDKTREMVLHTFEKSTEMVSDGMDISLLSISINPATPGKVQWSGANNPLWVIRGNEILETKADKQPIGWFEHAKPFTTHNFDLQKGDMLYAFTDGYADQFGGEKGKKFKYANLQKLLLEIASLPATEQHDLLAKKFSGWRGSMEQVDDVCIIGIRV